MAALTEQDQARIRAEEIYRAEVQAQLKVQAPERLGARIWRLLNSGIALWLLGTVAVGGIVAWKDGQDQSRQDRTATQKLDLEISARLNRLRGYLEHLETTGTALNVADVLRNTGPVRQQPWPMGVFSEFRERTLESLIWEVWLLAGSLERPYLMKAITSASEVRHIETEITSANRGADKLAFIRRIRNKLDEALNLPRWRTAVRTPEADE